MVKCSVCGEQIELRKENRYKVIIEAGTLQKSFGAKYHLYEAFDCPKCGCQMLMQERFPVKEETKTAEGYTEENGAQKKTVRSRLPHDGCNAIETEWKDDEASAESTKVETLNFGNKVKITYGPEKREGDDVTLDYLQKMSKDELIAYCGENNLVVPNNADKQYYINTIVDLVFGYKSEE